MLLFALRKALYSNHLPITEGRFMPYPHKQACCKDKVLISDRQRKKLNFCYAGQKKERFLTIRGIGQGATFASIPLYQSAAFLTVSTARTMSDSWSGWNHCTCSSFLNHVICFLAYTRELRRIFSRAKSSSHSPSRY